MYFWWVLDELLLRCFFEIQEKLFLDVVKSVLQRCWYHNSLAVVAIV